MRIFIFVLKYNLVFLSHRKFLEGYHIHNVMKKVFNKISLGILYV